MVVRFRSCDCILFYTAGPTEAYNRGRLGPRGPVHIAPVASVEDYVNRVMLKLIEYKNLVDKMREEGLDPPPLHRYEPGT